MDPDLDIVLQSNFECRNFDLDNINSSEILKNSNMNLFHVNIRSCNKNLDELILYLDSISVNFNVIMLSETWLNDTTEFTCIPDYVDFHSIRNRKGGGTTILIKNEFQTSLLPSHTINNPVIECVGVKVEIFGRYINFICVYRPPQGNIDLFNETFSSLLKDLPSDEPTFFAGDFNIDTLETNPSNGILSFKELILSEFFFPIIDVPTRVTETSRTCIDHIYTNCVQPILSGALHCDITDHHAIFCTIPFFNPHFDNIIDIKFRDHSDGNIDSLRTELYDKLSRFSCYTEFPINAQINILDNIIRKSYHKHCPIRHKHVSKRKLSSPWITPSLKRSINHKHWLRKQSFNNPELKPVFTRYRNVLQNTIKCAKRSYYYNKFQSNSSIRSCWKTINTLIRPKKGNNSFKIDIDGVKETNSGIISERFNDYFTSIAQNLASKIPSSNVNPLDFIVHQPNTFVFFECCESEIVTIIKQLKNNKCSLLEIPNHIYKSVADIIAPTLRDLINVSVRTGIFPDLLKTARVVPIHKSGSKQSMKNYRPISVLPTFSKIFEKSYVPENSLLL